MHCQLQKLPTHLYRPESKDDPCHEEEDAYRRCRKESYKYSTGVPGFAAKWSPRGEIIRCEFHWSFQDFVEFLEDEYRAPTGRIQKTPKGTKVQGLYRKDSKDTKGTRVFVRPTSSVRFLSLLHDDIVLTLSFT